MVLGRRTALGLGVNSDLARGTGNRHQPHALGLEMVGVRERSVVRDSGWRGVGHGRGRVGTPGLCVRDPDQADPRERGDSDEARDRETPSVACRG